MSAPRCEGCHKATDRYVVVHLGEDVRINACERCSRMIERVLTVVHVSYTIEEEKWDHGEKTTRTIRKVRQQ